MPTQRAGAQGKWKTLSIWVRRTRGYERLQQVPEWIERGTALWDQRVNPCSRIQWLLRSYATCGVQRVETVRTLAHNVEARQSPQGMPVCEMTATSSEHMQEARGKGNMRNFEKMKETGRRQRSRRKEPGAVATMGTGGGGGTDGVDDPSWHPCWSRNWVSSLDHQTAHRELSCRPFVGGESSLEIG